MGQCHGTLEKKTYSLFFLISRSNWAYSILSGNQPYTRPTHCMKCWSEFACLKSHWHLYWRILGNRGECVCLFVYAFCFSAFFKNISTTFCTHFCLGSRHTSFPLTSFTLHTELQKAWKLLREQQPAWRSCWRKVLSFKSEAKRS